MPRTLGLLALLASAPLAAQASEPTANNVSADFTIYVGGALFVEGDFSAQILDDDYALRTNMKTAGIAERFYPAQYKLLSEGLMHEEHVEPQRFVSDTKAKKNARVLRLTYDGERMPLLSAIPPYDKDELEEVKPALTRNTQDPVSAFLIPVSDTANPCARTLPIFDGRRRYNLTLAYQEKKTLKLEGSQKPVDAIVCTIRYEAIAPPAKKRRFTNMLKRNDAIKIWLAPFGNGRVYMPVRFELPTPIGSAVMMLKNLEEKQIALSTDKDSTRFALSEQ
tara:strand:+ start:14381 stop:15217 length:837 start_codon:yes stop_codon:yes gene_type:complete